MRLSQSKEKSLFRRRMSDSTGVDIVTKKVM